MSDLGGDGGGGGNGDIALSGYQAEASGQSLVGDPSAGLSAAPVPSPNQVKTATGQFSPADLARRTANLVHLYPQLRNDAVTLATLAAQPVSDDELTANVAGATTAANAANQAGILNAMNNASARYQRWQGYTKPQQDAIVATGFKAPANPKTAASFWSSIGHRLAAIPSEVGRDLTQGSILHRVTSGVGGSLVGAATGLGSTAVSAGEHAVGTDLIGAASNVINGALRGSTVGRGVNTVTGPLLGAPIRYLGPRADWQHLQDAQNLPKHLYRAGTFDPATGTRLPGFGGFNFVSPAAGLLTNLGSLIVHGQFPDAWERTDNHAPYYTAKAVGAASKELGANPEALRLAKAIASHGNDIDKGIVSYLGPPGGPNDVAHANAVSKAYAAAQSPDMVAAVRHLSLGGISYGRDTARGLGLHEGSAAFNAVSGGTDAAFSFYTDPTVMGAKVLEASRLARGLSSAGLAEAITSARLDDEMLAAADARSVKTYSEAPLRYAAELGRLDLGGGVEGAARRAQVMLADHIAGNDVTGLMAVSPYYSRAIPALFDANDARLAQGLSPIATANDINDFLYSAAGRQALVHGDLTSHLSPNAIELPHLTRTGAALGALKNSARSLLELSEAAEVVPGGLKADDLDPTQQFLAGSPTLNGTMGNRLKVAVATATSLIPRHGFLPLVGGDSVGQFADYVRQFHFPPDFERQAVETFSAATTVGVKRDITLHVLDAGLSYYGLDATEAGKGLIGQWMQAARTVYDVHGQDIMNVGGVDRAGTVSPSLDQAMAIAIPDPRTIRQISHASAALEALDNGLTNDKLAQLVGKVWAPAALLRGGEIPRLVLEEALPTWTRLRPGEVLRAYAAEGKQALMARVHAAETLQGSVPTGVSGPQDMLSKWLAGRGMGISNLVDLRNATSAEDAAAQMVQRGTVELPAIAQDAWKQYRDLVGKADEIRARGTMSSTEYTMAREAAEQFNRGVVKPIYEIMRQDPILTKSLANNVLRARGGYGDFGQASDFDTLDHNLRAATTMTASHDYEILKRADDADRSAAVYNYRRHGSEPIYRSLMEATEGYTGSQRQLLELRGTLAGTPLAAPSLFPPSAEQILAAATDLPAPAPGLTRYWRGTGPDWDPSKTSLDSLAGRWFSPDPEHALGFHEAQVAEGRNASLVYVDLPSSSVEDPRDAAEALGYPDRRWIEDEPEAMLHPSQVAQARPLGVGGSRATAQMPHDTLVSGLRWAYDSGGSHYDNYFGRWLRANASADAGDPEAAQKVADAYADLKTASQASPELQTLTRALGDDEGRLVVRRSTAELLRISPDAAPLATKEELTAAAKAEALAQMRDPANQHHLADLDLLRHGRDGEVVNPLQADRVRVYYPAAPLGHNGGPPPVDRIADATVRADVSRNLVLERPSTAPITTAAAAANGEGMVPLAPVGFMNDPQRALAVAKAYAPDTGAVGYVDVHPDLARAQNLAGPVPMADHASPLYHEAQRLANLTHNQAGMVKALAPGLDHDGIYLTDYQLAAGRALADDHVLVGADGKALLDHPPATPLPEGALAANGITYETALDELAERMAVHHTNLMMPYDEYLHDVSSHLLAQDGDRVSFSPAQLAHRPDSELPPITFGPQTLQMGEDHLWSLVVRFGFEKVLGPAIDAIARKPLFIHNLAQGIEGAMGLDPVLADAELRGLVDPLVEASGAADRTALLHAVEDHARMLDPDGVFPGFAPANPELDRWLSNVAEHRTATAPETPANVAQAVASVAGPGDTTQWDTLNRWRQMESNVASEITQTAAQRAINFTVPYINDSAVRSQAAHFFKTLAPFYWAQENWFRRWGRTLKYNPAAIEKIDLAMHGLRDMGAIRKNAYGQDVFTIPGSAALVGLLSGKAGGGGFSLAAPVPMTMEVRQVTPGFDRMGIPAAGPLISVPTNILANHFPEAAAVDKAMGGSGRSRALFDDLIPAGWARNIYHATTDNMDTSTQMSSARLQTMQMLKSAGLAPPENATPEQLDVWNARVRNLTRVTMIIRGGVSFFTPATPTLDYGGTPVKGVADAYAGAGAGHAVGDSGWMTADHINADLNARIKQMGLTAGVASFYGAHPDASAYTVFTTTSTGPGSAPPTTAALKALEANAGFFNEHSAAGAYFLPAGPGDFSPQAWLDELKDGLRQSKSFKDLATDVATQRASLDYWPMHDKYVAALAAEGDNTTARAATTTKWRAWEQDFLAAHPLFGADLASSTGTQKRAAALSDMRAALADPRAPKSPETDALRGMVKLYDQFSAARTGIGDGRDAESVARRHALDQRAAVLFTQYRGAHPAAGGFFDTTIRPGLNAMDRSFLSDLGAQP